MSINYPYRRTCRQLADGSYANSGHGRYIEHPKFAKSPEHYVRAFLLIQKDMEELFDYIEPSMQNNNCYSYRIHSLLIRACIEVEANLKAILTENDYVKDGDLRMDDYKKVEHSHRLSAYKVSIPTWYGEEGAIRQPFDAWSRGQSLKWYQAYNASKHDRMGTFHTATFSHMLDAICGCLVVLSAQFYTNGFSSLDPVLSLEGSSDGSESAIGGYFRVYFPDDWDVSERYDFDWRILESDPDPFRSFPYSPPQPKKSKR
jgi:hypothetical protein